MECPFCESDQWKMASLVFNEGLTHISTKTIGRNVNQNSTDSGGNDKVFDTSGTQQTGVSVLAQPPRGYKYSYIFGLIVAGSGFFLVQGFFLILPVFILSLVGFFCVFPPEKRRHLEDISNWKQTRMCLRCGKFYIPCTNYVLETASESLANDGSLDISTKAKCILLATAACGFLVVKYAEFIDYGFRVIFFNNHNSGIVKSKNNDHYNVLKNDGRIRIDNINGVNIEFVKIPAGRFVQGSVVDQSEKEHSVILTRPYYLGKYEVTQDLWKAVMENNPSNFVGSRNPVDNVSWLLCERFLNRLNNIAGTKKYRFPTESEWEYACKAGTSTKYYCGNKISSRFGNFGKNAAKTLEVGKCLANEFGLFDMHGNVAEWVSDWYGPYPSGEMADPSGILVGKHKVIRG